MTVNLIPWQKYNKSMTLANILELFVLCGCLMQGDNAGKNC